MAAHGGWFSRISELFGFHAPNGTGEDEPGVTWMLLPPYDIPGMAVVSGLLVENQGYEDAEAVFISLAYPSERFITHLEVVSEDPYDMEGGGPRDAYVKVQLPRMTAGHKLVIYVAGHSEQQPDVSVVLSSPSGRP